MVQFEGEKVYVHCVGVLDNGSFYFILKKIKYDKIK